MNVFPELRGQKGGLCEVLLLEARAEGWVRSAERCGAWGQGL